MYLNDGEPTSEQRAKCDVDENGACPCERRGPGCIKLFRRRL